jgi:hypothetical protein
MKSLTDVDTLKNDFCAKLREHFQENYEKVIEVLNQNLKFKPGDEQEINLGSSSYWRNPLTLSWLGERLSLDLKKAGYLWMGLDYQEVASHDERFNTAGYTELFVVIQIPEFKGDFSKVQKPF